MTGNQDWEIYIKVMKVAGRGFKKKLFSQKGVMPGETQAVGRYFYFASLDSLFLEKMLKYKCHLGR